MYQPTTIITQPTGLQPRDWSYGLCDCCGDCGECIYAYFCTACYVCQVGSRINENCCVFFFGGVVPMRTKIRTERKIQGSIVGDFCTFMCCPFCALVQMGREAKDTQSLI